MEKNTIERLRKSVAGNLGVEVPLEELAKMAREAEEHGACSRLFEDRELTLFSHKRGSVYAAVDVVEITDEDEPEEEDPSPMSTEGMPYPRQRTQPMQEQTKDRGPGHVFFEITRGLGRDGQEEYEYLLEVLGFDIGETP